MKKHYRHEQDCLNCGAELQGKFCHACGQENLHIKESFGHMMNHAISDYFHFDHQFFHTLKPLFFQPGKLTNEYMAGKRVQYLHPVKMYIFISLVYFLLLFQNGYEPVVIAHNAKDKKELAAVNKQLDSLTKSPNTPGIAKRALMVAKRKADTTKDEDDDSDTINLVKQRRFHIFGNSNSDKKDTTYQQYLSSQQKLSIDKRDNFFKKYVTKREFELNGNDTDLKKVLTEGIKHDAPKMMFLLLPLFALLLRITFWKNKKFYVEHLIYSFHFHCFLFLFLAVIMLITKIIPADWEVIRQIIYGIATLYIAWYIYQSLRIVYQRGPGKTISKMIGLSIAYTLVFSICMLFLIIIVALFS